MMLCGKSEQVLEGEEMQRGSMSRHSYVSVGATVVGTSARGMRQLGAPCLREM